MSGDHDRGDDLGRRLAAADAALPPAPVAALAPAALLARVQRRTQNRALAAVGVVALAALWLAPQPPGGRPEAAPTPGRGIVGLTAGLDALADRLQHALAADRVAAAAAHNRTAAAAVDRRLAEARAAAALAALTPLPNEGPR